MQVRYGNAFMPAGAASWTVRERALLNGIGQPYERRVFVSVRATIFGDTQAQIVQNAAVVEAALNRPYQDLELIMDGGGTAAALSSRLSTSGVRVIEVANPFGEGGFEYVSGRTFDFTATADYTIPLGRPVLLEMEETVDRSGGFPVFDYFQPPQGPPVRWQVYERTPYRAVQQGRAVGLYARPTPPPPLWPAALAEAPRFPQRSGKVANGVSREFPVEWAYVFASSAPLTGGGPRDWA